MCGFVRKVKPIGFLMFKNLHRIGAKPLGAGDPLI